LVLHQRGALIHSAGVFCPGLVERGDQGSLRGGQQRQAQQADIGTMLRYR